MFAHKKLDKKLHTAIEYASGSTTQSNAGLNFKESLKPSDARPGVSGKRQDPGYLSQPAG